MLQRTTENIFPQTRSQSAPTILADAVAGSPGRGPSPGRGSPGRASPNKPQLIAAEVDEEDPLSRTRAQIRALLQSCSEECANSCRSSRSLGDKRREAAGDTGAKTAGGPSPAALDMIDVSSVYHSDIYILADWSGAS